RRNPKCPMCGDSPTIKVLIDYEQFCGVPGHDAPVPREAAGGEIAPEELKARIDRGEQVYILDVRNPNEFQICRIPGSTLLPLPEFGQRASEVPRDREVVVHCKSGIRSAKAIQFLREQGYTNLKNLTGGILAWAERIDPSMPKY